VKKSDIWLFTSPFMRYVKGTQYLAINEKYTETRYLAVYDIPTRKAAKGSILKENEYPRLRLDEACKRLYSHIMH
jgi:hypothetical protein